MPMGCRSHPTGVMSFSFSRNSAAPVLALNQRPGPEPRFSFHLHAAPSLQRSMRLIRFVLFRPPLFRSVQRWEP